MSTKHQPEPAAQVPAAPQDMYLKDIVTLNSGPGPLKAFFQVTQLLHQDLVARGWRLVDQWWNDPTDPKTITNLWKLPDSNALPTGISALRESVKYVALSREAVDSEEQELLEPLDRELGGVITPAGDAATLILSQEFRFDFVDFQLKQWAQHVIDLMKLRGWKLAGWGNYITGRPGEYLIDWDVTDDATLARGRIAADGDAQFKQLKKRIISQNEIRQYRVPETTRGFSLSPQNLPLAANTGGRSQ